MKQIPPRYIKIAAIVFSVFLLVILIAGSIAYAKREALLNRVIKKAISKAKNEYNLDVKIEKSSFSGLSSVNFENVSVVPENRDSLAYFPEMRVGVKLLPLIFGDVKLSEIRLKDGWLNLIKKDTVSNYDFLFRKKSRQDSTKKGELDLAKLAHNLLNQVLYKIPDDMDVRNFTLKFQDDTNSISFLTREAIIDGGDVESTILVDGNQSTWHVDGTVDPDDQQLDLILYAEGKKVELPYLEKRFGLVLNFDTVHTVLRKAERNGDEFEMNGTWAVKNLLINHIRIASNDIVVPDASLDADVVFGKNFVAIDSTSTIHLEKIKANPFIKYTHRPSRSYELKLRTEEMNAQDMLDAFPVGLFESLDGMQVAGKLQYNLNFFLDEKNPDGVVFHSRLKNNGFKVLKWGKTNLQKINSTFVYTPYEYGKPMRDIVIGPSNPNFVPLNQISPYLRNAVLTAEDPSFFSHKGFVEESIRKSIATNFKEKAFKRGGSTISMQLVKNVFLNRQKTLARKVEEILIVWIMENGRLSTKSTMFETYLNLIEWGRNVYGIGEAAQHYFGKHASQLSLGESIFLASIVPRPKSGLYRFQGDGSLRTSLRGYFKLIGGLMARRGMTERDSSAYGFYSVRLREGLRSGIPVIDSLTADSLIIQDDPEEDLGILNQIFGGKRRTDSTAVKEANPKTRSTPVVRDTVLSPAEQRKQRREQRRKEREENKDND